MYIHMYSTVLRATNDFHLDWLQCSRTRRATADQDLHSILAHVAHELLTAKTPEPVDLSDTRGKSEGPSRFAFFPSCEQCSQWALNADRMLSLILIKQMN